MRCDVLQVLASFMGASKSQLRKLVQFICSAVSLELLASLEAETRKLQLVLDGRGKWRHPQVFWVQNVTKFLTVTEIVCQFERVCKAWHQSRSKGWGAISHERGRQSLGLGLFIEGRTQSWRRCVQWASLDRPLAFVGQLPSLTSLSVQDVTCFKWAESLPSLTALTIGRLADSPTMMRPVRALTNLRSLCIGKSTLSDHELTFFDCLTNLRVLKVDRSSCTTLHSLSAFDALETLHFREAYLSGGNCLKGLASLTNLTELNLHGNRQLSDISFSHCRQLPRLRSLYLGDCNINGSALEHFRSSPLEHISLIRTNVTDDLGPRLVPFCNSLTSLSIKFTPLTKDGINFIGRNFNLLTRLYVCQSGHSRHHSPPLEASIFDEPQFPKLSLLYISRVPNNIIKVIQERRKQLRIIVQND